MNTCRPWCSAHVTRVGVAGGEWSSIETCRKSLVSSYSRVTGEQRATAWLEATSWVRRSGGVDFGPTHVVLWPRPDDPSVPVTMQLREVALLVSGLSEGLAVLENAATVACVDCGQGFEPAHGQPRDRCGTCVAIELQLTSLLDGP